jgi:hypothetical protein
MGEKSREELEKCKNLSPRILGQDEQGCFLRKELEKAEMQNQRNENRKEITKE